MIKKLIGLLLAASLVISTPVLAENHGFNLDMRDVDIRQFVETVGKITGKTIVTDPKVKGRVTVQSAKALTADELYELFLLQLGVNGYAAIDMGAGVLKVVESHAAKLDGIEVLDLDGRPKRSEKIVTRLVKIEDVNVDKLVTSLRPMVDKRIGVISAYSDAGIIMIIERESNVRRLLEIIGQIDKVNSHKTETLALKNASASEVQQILTRLNSKSKGQGVEVTADNRSNTLIIRGDTASRKRARALVEELDQEVSVNSNVKVVYLKYAQAKDIAPVLAKVGGAIIKDEKGESKRSVNASSLQIEADEQTNALVLSGSPHIIKSLEDVVRKLDIRRAQVLVEAIIIEMTDARAKELGVQWLFQGDNDGTAPVGGINFANSGASIYSVGAAAAGNSESILGALGGLQGITTGVGRLRSSGVSFAALINALGSDTGSNILSTPSLLTLDNEEASILVGREVPLITGSTTGSNNANPFQTITREDVGIKLLVKPQINEGDAVQLTLEQEVSSLSGLTASDVITNKRVIKTSVLVNDGATIVLGGLIDEEIQESASKVPLLGDVPVLGRLFRSDRTSKTKNNLMVFIKPTIIRDQQTLTNLSADKYNYIRAEQLLNREEGVKLFSDDSLPVLPEWAAMAPAKPPVVDAARDYREATQEAAE